MSEALVLWIVLPVIAIGFLALIDGIEGGILRKPFVNLWKKIRHTTDADLVAKGVIKSKAYEKGYCDMAMGVYNFQPRGLSTPYPHYFDNSPRIQKHFPESVLRTLASNPETLRNFKPSMGRKKNEYLTSTDSQDFQDYYAGGMALLSDLDDVQAVILDEDTIVARRLAGLEDADQHYLESKKQLDMLRDKTFNREIEHKEFDALMGGPKRKFWQRKEVV